jgi:hypothetical protein
LANLSPMRESDKENQRQMMITDDDEIDFLWMNPFKIVFKMLHFFFVLFLNVLKSLFHFIPEYTLSHIACAQTRSLNHQLHFAQTWSWYSHLVQQSAVARRQLRRTRWWE